MKTEIHIKFNISELVYLLDKHFPSGANKQEDFIFDLIKN